MLKPPIFILIIGILINGFLVGGWTNPVEKYESKWEYSPNFGVNIKNILKPPPIVTSFFKVTYQSPQNQVTFSARKKVTCGSKQGHDLKNLVGIISWDVVNNNRGGRYESQHIIRIHKLKW